MKKALSVIILIIMVSSIILTTTSCSIFNISKNNNKTNNNDNTNNNVVEIPADSYVSVDINPEITLTLDKNGVVLTAVGENEDAQVLLWGEKSLVGMNIEAAVEQITLLASELGYLSEENGTVSVIASGCENSAALDALVSKISAKITATAKQSDLSVTVDTEGAYSLLRQYEAFINEHPDLASTVTVSKFKMALAAHESGDITLVGAVELDDSELIKRIAGAHSEIEAYYTETYEKLHAEAMRVYEIALETEVEKVYAEYLVKKGMILDAKILYAYIYQMYAIASRGLFAAAGTIDFFDTARNYELDEARVSAILISLGLNENEADKLKDSDGKITLDSVLEYADVYLKNLDENVDKEAIKAAIDASIASAEADVIAEADRLANEYKPQIRNMIESSKLVKSTYDSVIGTISPLLPQSLKDEFNGLIADYEKALSTLDTILSGESFDTDDIRAVAIDLKASADKTLGKLEGMLNDDALAEIESEKQAKRDALSAQKAIFEQTIANARKDAEERLAALKAAKS